MEEKLNYIKGQQYKIFLCSNSMVHMAKIIKYLFLIAVAFLTSNVFAEKSNCNSADNLHSKKNTLLFECEHLDTLTEAQRLAYFKRDNRVVIYFDKEENITNQDNAYCITTIKKISKGLYLMRDYYKSGENRVTGFYKARIQYQTREIDWEKMYKWHKNESQAREIGKFICRYRIGLISYIQFYTYSNFEKGYGSSCTIPVDKYQNKLSTDFEIKNNSSLKASVIFEQKNREFQLPNYYGGIRASLNGKQLLFCFNGNKVMFIRNDSIVVSRIVSLTSFPSQFNSKMNRTNFHRQVSIGELEIKFSEMACDDTNYNQLLLVTNSGEIQITGLLNTELFIIDSDGDGEDELYIFSFRSCSEEFKLIKIG